MRIEMYLLGTWKLDIGNWKVSMGLEILQAWTWIWTFLA